ncbi:MAG: hypothetical protein OEW18_12610 [Candidatus Aminicenantes bacterium]|nr:hypothetical protein [Candidatus Aminicenantes bacterium]
MEVKTKARSRGTTPVEMFKSPNDPKLLTLMKKGFVKTMISRTISRYRIAEDAA